MAERRKLSFSSLDQVIPDVDRLAAGNHTLGQWSLAQICNHLSKTMRYSVDGFPGKPVPWLIRKVMAGPIMRRMLQTGEMPAGQQGPAYLMPAAGLDASAEVESLRTELARFVSHKGQPAFHPFFGTLTREQWEFLHRIHCALHLSFAVPDKAG
jgi:hypothetical protein